jgi:hypothetical protein
MASAVTICPTPYGAIPDDGADLIYNALNVGIRRCEACLIIKTLDAARDSGWAPRHIRQVLLASIAANVGHANPILFKYVAELPLSTSPAPTSSSTTTTTMTITSTTTTASADIVRWVQQTVSWLIDNECYSFDVIYFHELASALLCYDREYMPLLCHGKEQLIQWAQHHVAQAVHMCTPSTVEQAMLAFAYLLYMNPNALAGLFEARLRLVELVDGKTNLTAAVNAALNCLREPNCAPILFTYTFLLLLVRNEINVDPNGTVSEHLDELVADHKAVTDVYNECRFNGVYTPDCVYDITTAVGRCRGADLDSYLEESLFTEYRPLESPAPLAWLRARYIERLVDHYDRQLSIIESLRATQTKKIVNKVGRLPKLSRAQRDVANEYVAERNRLLERFNAACGKHLRPMCDPEQINAVLQTLLKTNSVLSSPTTARRRSSSGRRSSKLKPTPKRKRNLQTPSNDSTKTTDQPKKRATRKRRKKTGDSDEGVAEIDISQFCTTSKQQ